MHLHTAVAECADALSLNLGKVAQPLRVALTGTSASPSIELTLQMVGRDAALSRIDRAIAYVRERSSGSAGSAGATAATTGAAAAGSRPVRA